MKTYIRSKVNPELWATLSKIKKMPKSFIMELAEDIALNARFFLRKRKGFLSVPCLVPFMRLEFQDTGSVSACCIAFTKIKSVGDMNCQTIEQIWNGTVMKRFRKYLLLGETAKTCMPKCEYLNIGPISLEEMRLDTEEGKSLHDDIMHGRAKLKSHPLRFNLANSKTCNLKCVMCRDNYGGLRKNSLPEHLLKTNNNLKNHFDKKITLYLTGNGDVLARKDTRGLLHCTDD